MLGYTWQDTQHNNGGNDGELTYGPELQDDLFVGAAIGVELTPWLGFEAEYSQVKGDVDTNVGEYKAKTSQVTSMQLQMSLLATMTAK